MIAPEIYNALNKWAIMVVAQAKSNLLRGKRTLQEPYQTLLLTK
jgi:hypothetical protein